MFYLISKTNLVLEFTKFYELKKEVHVLKIIKIFRKDMV